MDDRDETVRVELLPEHPAFGDPEVGPQYLEPSHPGDAGIDLIACEAAVLEPGDRKLVSAGIRIALPPGLEGQVRPRSGQALRSGLTVANAPGTIDPGYRGPVQVILLNTAPILTSGELAECAECADYETFRKRLASARADHTIRIEPGERIAQLVFARFQRPPIRIVDGVSLETPRGEGGFGSTGIA
jgi:dUTP pyrophosphatase